MFKYLGTFLSMIGQKLQKSRGQYPQKNLVIGGSDGYAGENSGNVVGGHVSTILPHVILHQRS